MSREGRVKSHAEGNADSLTNAILSNEIYFFVTCYASDRTNVMFGLIATLLKRENPSSLCDEVCMSLSTLKCLSCVKNFLVL